MQYSFVFQDSSVFAIFQQCSQLSSKSKIYVPHPNGNKNTARDPIIAQTTAKIKNRVPFLIKCLEANVNVM